MKNVDWQAVYRLYRPKVTARTSDDELFDVLATMIAHLNDNHVSLRSPSRRFGAGILQELHMEDFSVDLPNGWRFSAPFNLFRDRDGFCWEGIGIPPDYRQINTKADIDAKRDRAYQTSAHQR